MRRGFHRFGWGVGHHFAGAHIIGGIAMIALWAAIIVGIVVMIVWLVRHRHYTPAVAGGGAAGVETPLDVLKRRFAAGEIEKTEYEEKKKDLST